MPAHGHTRVFALTYHRWSLLSDVWEVTCEEQERVWGRPEWTVLVVTVPSVNRDLQFRLHVAVSCEHSGRIDRQEFWDRKRLADQALLTRYPRARFPRDEASFEFAWWLACSGSLPDSAA